MSSGVFQRSEEVLKRQSVRTEPSGRTWNAIGVGLAAAFVLIGLYGIVIWAIVVLAQALI